VYKSMRLFLISLSLVPALSWADGKIAVVSLQEAILNTTAAQTQLNTLRTSAEYKKNKDELESLQKSGKELVEKLKKDGPTMSKDQQAELTHKIENTRGDLEHVGRKLQDQEKELAQRLFYEMGNNAKTAVNEIIKTEGIGLLLDRQAALHADSAYNITPKVTEKLNKSR